jgi:hypothetical protein
MLSITLCVALNHSIYQISQGSFLVITHSHKYAHSSPFRTPPPHPTHPPTEPRYYFVGFFGEAFGVYDGLQFVYRFSDGRQISKVERHFTESFAKGGIEVQVCADLPHHGCDPSVPSLVCVEVEPHVSQVDSFTKTDNQLHHGVSEFIHSYDKKLPKELKPGTCVVCCVVSVCMCASKCVCMCMCVCVCVCVCACVLLSRSR